MKERFGRLEFMGRHEGTKKVGVVREMVIVGYCRDLRGSVWLKVPG
jgi:hypothetical protein